MQQDHSMLASYQIQSSIDIHMQCQILCIQHNVIEKYIPVQSSPESSPNSFQVKVLPRKCQVATDLISCEFARESCNFIYLYGFNTSSCQQPHKSLPVPLQSKLQLQPTIRNNCQGDPLTPSSGPATKFFRQVIMHILHSGNGIQQGRYLGYDYGGVLSTSPTFCVQIHPPVPNLLVKQTRIVRY